MDPHSEELLAAFAAQHANVGSLLESFFGFLHRRSDLYVVTEDPAATGMGFKPGQAEQAVCKPVPSSCCDDLI